MKNIPRLVTNFFYFSTRFCCIFNAISARYIQHLSHWEPTRIHSYFDLDEMKERIENDLKNLKLDTGISLAAFDKKRLK